MNQALVTGAPGLARPVAGFQVREAAASDVEALVELYRREGEFHQRLAGYYQLDPGFDWTAFVRYRLEGSERVVHVAEKGGALIGFAYLSVAGYCPPRGLRHRLRRLLGRRQRTPGLPIRPLAWGVIEDCFVLDAFRRQGVGDALVSRPLEWFASRGLRRVELTVLQDNPGAREFWEALGFAPFRVSMSRDLEGTAGREIS